MTVVDCQFLVFDNCFLRCLKLVNCKAGICAVGRKPTTCICENKDDNCEADQHLCFRYTDSTSYLLLKFEILSF